MTSFAHGKDILPGTNYLHCPVIIHYPSLVVMTKSKAIIMLTIVANLQSKGKVFKLKKISLVEIKEIHIQGLEAWPIK